MVQTMNFLIVEPSPLPFSSLLGPNIRLRILFSNTLSLHSSLNVRVHFYLNMLDKKIVLPNAENKVFPVRKITFDIRYQFAIEVFFVTAQNAVI